MDSRHEYILLIYHCSKHISIYSSEILLLSSRDGAWSLGLTKPYRVKTVFTKVMNKELNRVSDLKTSTFYGCLPTLLPTIHMLQVSKKNKDLFYYPWLFQMLKVLKPRSCKRSETLYQISSILFLTWREYFYSQPTHFSSQPKK